jgi:DNA modification methylase
MPGSLIQGNALHIPLKDKSVQLCCFSPPYWNLRKYSVSDIDFPDGWKGQMGLEPTINQFLDNLMLTMAEVWRVLRDDGVCFVNLADKLVNKSLCLVPQKFAICCQEAGWIVRSEIIFSKKNPMPESCRDRPTKSHEQIWMLTKKEKYFWDQEAVKEKTLRIAKVGWKESDLKKYSCDPRLEKQGTYKNWRKYCPTGIVERRNIRSVWTLSTEANRDQVKISHLTHVALDVASCGMIHIVSPYCPVHGDLFVQVAKEFCGESPIDWLSHIIRICNHLFQKRAAGFDLSEKIHILKILQRSLGYFCQSSSQIAIGYNKQTHKKALSLLTNPSYNSFVEILSCTEHKPELLFYFVLYASIYENNILAGALGECGDLLAQIPHHTVDKHTLPIPPECLCSYYTKKTETTSHFATFPSKLIDIIVRAGSSPRACEICGAPWARILKKDVVVYSEECEDRYTGKYYKEGRRSVGRRVLKNMAELRALGRDHDNPFPRIRTVGWRKTCKCDCAGTGRCVVFDPFVGVGTSVLVAEKQGRAGVGMDLSLDYLVDIALKKTRVPVQKMLELRF